MSLGRDRFEFGLGACGADPGEGPAPRAPRDIFETEKGIGR